MKKEKQITIEHFKALIMGKIMMQLDLDFTKETARKLDKISNELIDFAKQHELKFTNK